MSNKFERYMAGASVGIPHAMWKVGNCYFQGYLAEQSFEKARHWYSKAAECGSMLGCRDFGRMLQYGIGGPIDAEKAAICYGIAASQGELRATYELAMMRLYGKGVSTHRQSALDLLRTSAAYDCSKAKFILSFVQALGTIPPFSIGETESLLQTAERQGVPGASLAAGLLYLSLEPKFMDVEAAFNYFEKSANANEPEGLYRKGYALFHGIGCAQNPSEGINLIMKAAEMGLADAEYYIGVCFFNGICLPQSEIQALSWFTKASDREPHALYKVLNFNHQNIVLDPSNIHKIWNTFKANPTLYSIVPAASFLFSISKSDTYIDILGKEWALQIQTDLAERGFSNATNHLGYYYLHEAKERDAVRGMFWLQTSAEDSNENSAFGVGIELFSGEVIPKNVLEALSYLEDVSKMACPPPPVLSYLGRLFYNGNHESHVIRNKPKAAEYFKLASAAGDADSSRMIAQMLFYGDGVPQDIEASNQYFELSERQQATEHVVECKVDENKNAQKVLNFSRPVKRRSRKKC